MDLPEYIRSLAPNVEGAIERASELFDEKPGTVKAWLYRERYPRKQSARKIVNKTSGTVTFADIYGERRA